MNKFTNQQIDAAVCKRFGQSSANWVEGPYGLGEYTAWRVWTEADGDYHAHYAAHGTDNKLEIFENFSPFSNWLNHEFDLHGKNSRALNDLPILISSIVVLVGLGLVVYMAVKSPQQSFPLAAMLTAVIGGGAGYLFARRRGHTDKAKP